MSSGVVQNMLRSCQTMFMQVHLLKLLCHSKFGIGFNIMGKFSLDPGGTEELSLFSSSSKTTARDSDEEL